MTKIMRAIILSTVLTAGLAGSANAALLANYTLNNAATSSDADANSTAGSVTATGVTLGYGAAGGQTGLLTTANAVDNGDYYAFTVNANLGYLLNLNGGTFSIQDRATDAGTFSYSVFSSVDSYTTALGTYSLGTANVWTTRNISLSGATYDNLSSVTFRIVMSDNSSANSRDLLFDNITLDGLTAVPEKSTVAAGIFGLLFAGTALTRKFLARRA
jgi:hypothetical protein